MGFYELVPFIGRAFFIQATSRLLFNEWPYLLGTIELSYEQRDDTVPGPVHLKMSMNERRYLVASSHRTSLSGQ